MSTDTVNDYWKGVHFRRRGARPKLNRVEPYLALHRAIELCGSPLEERFVLAFLASPEVFTFAPHDDGFWIDARAIELHQQVWIGGARADFVLQPGRIVVELDGYEHHDSSPELAARDKRRDRVMVAGGWRVLRFAGREVNRDALACAKEAYAIATRTVVRAVPRPGQLELPLVPRKRRA